MADAGAASSRALRKRPQSSTSGASAAQDRPRGPNGHPTDVERARAEALIVIMQNGGLLPERVAEQVNRAAISFAVARLEDAPHVRGLSVGEALNEYADV